MVPSESLRAIDALFVEAAGRLGVPVVRGGDAYVHWDGRLLHVADDEHLDADDSLAQLVLHELCHALVQGEPAFRLPDWGLDNTRDVDAVREEAAVRVQAHLLGAFGLRGLLHPTTEVRAFYDALGADALAPMDAPSVILARQALLEGTRGPSAAFAPVVGEALFRTVVVLGLGLHRSGFPLSASGRCGDCAWRSPGGLCRAALARIRVREEEPACVRHEAQLDCRVCAACCGPAFDSVDVPLRSPLARRHPEWITVRGARASLDRPQGRCPALSGDAGAFACAEYALRPRSCRDFEVGGRHCLQARRRVGLSV
jgi:hypothetical protein